MFSLLLGYYFLFVFVHIFNVLCTSKIFSMFTALLLVFSGDPGILRWQVPIPEIWVKIYIIWPDFCRKLRKWNKLGWRRGRVFNAPWIRQCFGFDLVLYLLFWFIFISSGSRIFPRWGQQLHKDGVITVLKRSCGKVTFSQAPCSNFLLKMKISIISVEILVWLSMRKFF